MSEAFDAWLAELPDAPLQGSRAELDIAEPAREAVLAQFDGRVAKAKKQPTQWRRGRLARAVAGGAAITVHGSSHRWNDADWWLANIHEGHKAIWNMAYDDISTHLATVGLNEGGLVVTIRLAERADPDRSSIPMTRYG